MGLPEHADSFQQSTCSLIVWQGICVKYQSLWHNVCIQHSLSWAFFVLGVFCSGSWQSWITCSKRRASRRAGQWSAVLVGPFQLLVLIPTCLFLCPMFRSFWLPLDVHHYSNSQYHPFFFLPFNISTILLSADSRRKSLLVVLELHIACSLSHWQVAACYRSVMSKCAMMYPRWYQQRNISTFPGAVIAWIRCQAQLTQTDVDLEEISAAQHADFLGRVLLATGEMGPFGGSHAAGIFWVTQ